MHYCTKCGAEVSDKVKFCPKCGSIQKVNRKEYDNTSNGDSTNDYTITMPKIPPVESKGGREIYETQNDSKGDIVKLVFIGTFIGMFILAAACGGYYLFAEKDNSLNKQNNNKIVEKTEDSKNNTAEKDDNTSKDNKEANKTNDMNTSNKEAKAGDYIFYDSSNLRLTDAQLNSLSRENLSLARNEIYARHGFVFQTEPYKSYFSNKTWYKANPSFKGSDEEINEVERYNVQQILKYENGK